MCDGRVVVDYVAECGGAMTEKQVREVADEALVSSRTVYKWLRDPESVNDNNRKRIEMACKKLRVKR